MHMLMSPHIITPKYKDAAGKANRTFFRLLREVREGRSYVVNSHGKPIARIVPCTQADTARAAARSALLQRLALRPAIDIGRWTRDELYEG